MGTTAVPPRHGAVVEALGREITDGALAPGDTLTLDQIQRRFGVSRTVAREAMRLLEALGLVRSGRRVGIVVQPSQGWAVFDPLVIRWRLAGPGRAGQLRSLTQLRGAVEPAAAAGAAEHADWSDRAWVVELAGRLRVLGEGGRLEEFLAVDQEFHALLLRACGNEMFAALTDVVGEVLAGRTHLGLMPAHPEPRALDLHEAVARAVQGGDPATAADAMAEIVREAGGALEAATAGPESGF